MFVCKYKIYKNIVRECVNGAHDQRAVFSRQDDIFRTEL